MIIPIGCGARARPEDFRNYAECTVMLNSAVANALAARMSYESELSIIFDPPMAINIATSLSGALNRPR